MIWILNKQFSFYIFVSTSGAPPTPKRVNILNVASTSITVSWSEDTCNGGHQWQYVSIAIKEHNDEPPYFYSYRYIDRLEVHQMNYTVTGLIPSTSYGISVQAEGTDRTYSAYSPLVAVTTSPPGKYILEAILN